MKKTTSMTLNDETVSKLRRLAEKNAVSVSRQVEIVVAGMFTDTELLLILDCLLVSLITGSEAEIYGSIIRKIKKEMGNDQEA